VQAIVQERYGGPEVLVSREIDRPEIGDREVLVRVHAAGLHIGDVFGVRGSPFPVRFSSGLRGPKLGVPGFDIAGTVEATGRAVTRFAPGDEVFGVCTWPSSGACAEYARADEDKLIAKPSAMSFEQAAAIPTSASAALHGLRDAGRLQAGQQILINGASGGVGTYAVQIARAFGAEVTGVCGPTNVELVRSLGAHHVIDYIREDFTQGNARYDVILDNIENHSLADCRRALAPDGTLVLMSGTGASGLGLAVDRRAGRAEVGQQPVDGVEVERIDLAAGDLGREALAVPVRQQPHDDHGLLDPGWQTRGRRTPRHVEQRGEAALLVPDSPAVQARPADAEGQGGGDALVTCHPHAARPEAKLRETRAELIRRWPASSGREEQEVRAFLVGVSEEAPVGILPVVGLERIHSGTLRRVPHPCLTNPGNYT
jgi:NADPH:quinone reductase-like Zn-dependent oxidoreductase